MASNYKELISNNRSDKCFRLESLCCGLFISVTWLKDDKKVMMLPSLPATFVSGVLWKRYSQQLTMSVTVDCSLDKFIDIEADITLACDYENVFLFLFALTSTFITLWPWPCVSSSGPRGCWVFWDFENVFFSIWLRNQHWRSSDLDPVSPDELFRVMVLCKHILLLRDVIRCWVSLVLKSAIKNKAYYTGIRPWWPFPRSNNRRKLNTSINLAFWMILTLCVIPKFIIHSKNLTGPGHIIWNLWKGAKKCYM